MANLTYEQFKTEITENIKDYLPDDYMVEDINESSVEPEERLSNSVYKYDAESKSLCIVA